MTSAHEHIPSLDLSFEELRWLAGAFGAARLPLTIPSAQTESLLEAQNLLQQRGIIKRGALAGWEVEPFAALVVQWLVSGLRFWLFERFGRDGQRIEIALFLQDGPAMLVLPVQDGKRFIVCRDVDAAILEWQLALSLTDATKAVKQPEWDIPQPVTVIRTGWKNPTMAQTMADANFLAWAARLDWAAEWALVTGENRFVRLALASRDHSLWVGRYTPGRPGEFSLKPSNKKNLAQALRQVLKEVK